MNTESLSQTIKNALEKYDNINEKYISYINNPNFDLIISGENEDQIRFNFDNTYDDFEYEYLGYFDNQNYIWIWSWVFPRASMKETKISRELLEYGLKLEPESNTYDHFMIKSLLVNSRIQIEESIQLEINLAIYTSLLRDKIKFIFPVKRIIDDSNQNFITNYYIIK
jgi:hypothetical protein